VSTPEATPNVPVVNNQQQFFTPSQAATLLQVSSKTVLAWARQKKIDALIIGDTVRIPREVLYPANLPNRR